MSIPTEPLRHKRSLSPARPLFHVIHPPLQRHSAGVCRGLVVLHTLRPWNPGAWTQQATRGPQPVARPVVRVRRPTAPFQPLLPNCPPNLDLGFLVIYTSSALTRSLRWAAHIMPYQVSTRRPLPLLSQVLLPPVPACRRFSPSGHPAAPHRGRGRACALGDVREERVHISARELVAVHINMVCGGALHQAAQPLASVPRLPELDSNCAGQLKV